MVWGWSNYNNPATSGIADGELIQLAIGDGNAPPTLFDFFNSQQDLWGFWLEWQADMVVFDTFQASINQRLDAAGIKVRVDRVDDVMAFTSTRVGTEHVNGAAPIESRIDFSIVGSNIFQTRVTQQFGFALSETAKGSGDTNFRLHVVDTRPQLQIGADGGQTMRMSFSKMSAKALGVENLDLTTIDGAQRSIGKINMAIDRVSAERSKLGAFQNRLGYTISNLNNAQTNLISAESRLRDADIAAEMIDFTRDQIVSQAGTAMLAQANLVPQGVLRLLQ